MIMREMYKNMGICDEVYDYCDNIIRSLHDRFEEIDKNAEYNQMKVIKAMQDNKVAEMHLSGTTGYGYNDDGRDTLEKVYSDIFKTEDALVRPQIICGTHALNVALSSNLRPGDELLSPVGKPYDTMDEIIGIRPSKGSLAEFLGYYLRMIKKNIQVIKTGNSNELFEQMMYIGKGDVAIGISFPRYSMRTLKAMEFANNRQARVIAITDSIHSPMNMYSSCNLFARSDMASIVDSLVAPMSLINALIVSLCLKNSEQVVENIEKINAFVDNFEYSGNDEINMLDENVVNELRKCMDNAAIDKEK